MAQMNKDSDTEVTENSLLQQIAGGSESAFEMLFRQHYRTLCNYAYSRISDREEDEEVVQDVFCRIWEQREKLAKLQSVKAYLFRCVHNSCLNKIRHQKIRQEYMEHSARENSIEVSPVTGFQLRELQDKLQAAISALPEQCGLVFKLSRYEELSYKEIATVLGISIKTVENHMGKALKIMRLQMADYLTIFIFLFTYLQF
jgi:RNA polymerase sigma-70 factor (family 1)